MQDLLTIGDVARRSGVAASALRFYEQRGLIRSERAGSGHRRYPRAVLRRIAFIVFAQRIGLSLEEIAAEVARLPGNHVPVRADWARLSGSWTLQVVDGSPGDIGTLDAWGLDAAPAVCAPQSAPQPPPPPPPHDCGQGNGVGNGKTKPPKAGHDCPAKK